jgi:hypothetical protein
MLPKRWNLSLVGLMGSCVLAMLLAFSTALPALATGCLEDGTTTCVYTLGGGALSSSRGIVTLAPTSLDGSDQTWTLTLPVDVTNQNGTGWLVQVGLTQFSNPNHTLPTVLGVALTGQCDAGSSCSLPNGAMPPPGMTIPLPPSIPTMIAAGSTPTGTTVIVTAPNGPFFFGMGSMTITTTLTASMFAKDTYAGTYTGLLLVSVATLVGPT